MKIKNLFIVSTLLSLIWHSFSFFLFKLAQPYSREESFGAIDVSLVNLSKNIQRRTMSAKISELNKKHPMYSRFALPHTGAGMPLVEIPVGAEKKVFLDREPDFQSRLVEHSPVFYKKNDFGSQLDYDMLPDVVKNVGYSFNFNRLSDSSETRSDAKTLQFSIRGTVADRPLLRKTVLPKQNKNDYLALNFSIDDYGKVKFVIIEKYSGSPQWVRQVVNSFKAWRFESAERISQSGGGGNFDWGRITFF